ncbi:MAG: M23 family metallopeptidase [Rhodoferax sp.]|uniref:M23 family metallopeptidase n=1 Tax=Rhodoferax sp. TaxID=50421 RepID=UPI003263A1F1
MSYLMEWHGGVHLTAPMGETPNVSLPVRAIADGMVVYVRKKTDVDAKDVDAPLNYGEGYTSDGVVVIRHHTEIGAPPQGQAVQVQFYSVYLHLDSISPTVIEKRCIYRKDEIGQAGHIEGKPHLVHFEICCDDANLARLVGRSTGDLSLTNDGRTDVLFGEMYFYLPAGTPVYPAKPLPQYVQAMVQPPAVPSQRGQPAAPRPAPQPLQAVHTTADALVVGLLYAGGAGVVNQRGDAVLTSYHLDGTPVSAPAATTDSPPIVIRETGAEYQLYTTAKAISEAYPATARPTTSAVYELLRFGRVIGPDALVPADVPHWREVATPEGRGWVNLNAGNVHKYSDADFPQWKDWTLVDDDTNGDSRCDSATLKRLVFTDKQGAVQPFNRANAEGRLRIANVRKKLANTVCRFPSEWDASTIDARWAWLKTADAGNPEPLSGTDYDDLKAHLQALCIPRPELFSAQWCFDPREFIRHFRMCGWLSARELAQCFPRRQLHLNATTFHPATTDWDTALAKATTWSTSFNKTNRRYGLSANKQRLVHYFSHVLPETGYLSQMKEGDNKSGTYLKSKPYFPYYGRGLIQLTWLATYQKYGVFRGFPNVVTSGIYQELKWDPDILIAFNNAKYNALNCADSACFYVSSHSSMMRKMDGGLTQSDGIAVSKCVNGDVPIQNLNGLDIRLQSIIFLQNFIMENTTISATETLTFSWRRNSNAEIIMDDNGVPKKDKNGNPKKGYILRENSWVIEVPLEKQRP